MTLHILFTSPAQGSCLAECRRVSAPGDALLLSGDGVCAAIGQWGVELEQLHAAGVAIFAIDEDCRARGIDGRLPDFVKSIGYEDFVDLAAGHARSVSWF